MRAREDKAVWLRYDRVSDFTWPPNLASIPLPARHPLCQIAGLKSRKAAAASTGRKSPFQNVMVRRTSSLFSVSTSTSKSSSLYPPSALSAGWDADDEDSMSISADEYVPSRPISVAIPRTGTVHGPYCPRRPNLREILANTSEAPWTLAAFMAYLSNNHCLETLEFTMDAGRYKKHYAKMLSRAAGNGTPPSKDREYVRALWQRLVEAYIQPNGSREVNLPSDVRDPILNLSPEELPPPPEALDSAVSKIYELMEESVLVPFLNSVYPQTAHPTVSSCPSDESLVAAAQAYEDRSAYSRSKRHARTSPPPQQPVEPHSHSYTAPSMMNRESAPSTLTTSMNRARFSVKLSPTTSSPATIVSNSANAEASGSDINVSGSGSGPGMTDDSGSTDSPANESPMTPPASPPMSDTQSPKRDSGMWKKLGRLSGMKVGKKKSQGGLTEEQ